METEWGSLLRERKWERFQKRQKALLLFDKRYGGCFNLQVIWEEVPAWRWSRKAGQAGEMYVELRVFFRTPRHKSCHVNVRYFYLLVLLKSGIRSHFRRSLISHSLNRQSWDHRMHIVCPTYFRDRLCLLSALIKSISGLCSHLCSRWQVELLEVTEEGIPSAFEKEEDFDPE